MAANFLSYFTILICMGLTSCSKIPDKTKSPSISPKTLNKLPAITGDSPDNHKDYDVRVGWSDTYDTLSKLKFLEISEGEYSKYSEKRSDEKFVNGRIKENDLTFTIPTKKENLEYKKYREEAAGWEGYEYLGYYPELQLYAITSNWTAESMGFGELILINRISGTKYNIISMGDGPVSSPLPSPENNYLVYYDNSVYENKYCTIGILKINNRSNSVSYLQEFLSFESDFFAIEELLWISDRSFAVKGYEEVYVNEQWIKKFKYYKTSF